jgi:fatty-acyl-CoA synthase
MDPIRGEAHARDGERATVEEIRAFCEGRIAHYKAPRYVKFVDAFPT